MESESKGELLSPDQQAIIANREAQKLDDAVAEINIKNDADLAAATEMLAQVKATAKNIDAQKSPIVKGLNEQIKAIRLLFKPSEDRLSNAERVLKAGILKYHEMVAKKAEKSAKRIEGKVDAGEMDLQTGMGKLSNIKQAQTISHAASGSAQIRVVKKVRITDAAALPASYFLRPSVLEALRKEVSADVLQKKLPCPTGAEVYEEKGVAVNAS